MPFEKPFHRIYRPLVPGSNSGYSSWKYIKDKEYAESPEHYVRAFLILQDDLKKLFEYIEPADVNLPTYSYRIHELFIRTCIEIEANFKAILLENEYSPENNQKQIRKENTWNLKDYRKIEISHHLSSYEVLVPIWNGEFSVFKPFKEWKNRSNLTWYSAYNKSKHNRQTEFQQANFENLINAITGLLVVLSSQFGQEDFSPGNLLLSAGDNDFYKFSSAIGKFFRIKFPDDWDESEKYQFDWQELKDKKDRFNKFNYNEVRF